MLVGWKPPLLMGLGSLLSGQGRLESIKPAGLMSDGRSCCLIPLEGRVSSLPTSNLPIHPRVEQERRFYVGGLNSPSFKGIQVLPQLVMALSV